MAYGVLDMTDPDILNAFVKNNLVTVAFLFMVVIVALIYPIENGHVYKKSTKRDMDVIIDYMTVSKGYNGRRKRDIIYVRKLHSLVYAQSLHPV